MNLLKGITRQIKEIRRQLSYEKQLREHSLQRNINRIAALRRQDTNFTIQANYMPVVISVYLSMPFHGQTMPMKYDMQISKESRIFDNGKTKTRTKNKLRWRKILRKWKKNIYCVLLPLFLKKICQQVRTKRQSEFVKIFSNLTKKVSKIKDELIMIVQQVEEGIFSRKNSLSITESEDKRDINQKNALIKEVINQMLSKINTFSKKTVLIVQQVKFYIICAVMELQQHLTSTIQQLQISQISKDFAYISADYNLEIIAIVNFVIVEYQR